MYISIYKKSTKTFEFIYSQCKISCNYNICRVILTIRIYKYNKIILQFLFY